MQKAWADLANLGKDQQEIAGSSFGILHNQGSKSDKKLLRFKSAFTSGAAGIGLTMPFPILKPADLYVLRTPLSVEEFMCPVTADDLPSDAFSPAGRHWQKMESPLIDWSAKFHKHLPWDKLDQLLKFGCLWKLGTIRTDEVQALVRLLEQ